MDRDPESPDVNEIGRDRNIPEVLGGADAVPKTTYVSGIHGTDPTDDRLSAGSVTAPVGHDPGLGVNGWVALILAALIAAAYALGFLG